LADLKSRKYLESTPQSPENYRIYAPPFLATEKPAQVDTIELKSLNTANQNFRKDTKGSSKDWFRHLGRLLVVNLTLAMRRAVCDRTGDFNYQAQPPSLPLQGLSVSDGAQDILAKETGNVFGNAAWLDHTENGWLQLRVSGERDLPPHGHMNNRTKTVEYDRIEREGDGYISYVGICISLLTKLRPVALIDEPELCLHPPQAHQIGRFIGSYAPPSHVSFVSTHSSSVLRGILETSRNVKVVRLTRKGKQFSGQLLSKNEIDLIRHPRTRAEAVLDGIFAKGVVLVESEGDREVYQAAAESIEGFPAREVHFVAVGGTGGFAAPLRFLRALKIPVAVIADLDAIIDTRMIEAIVPYLTGKSDVSLEIVTDAVNLAQMVKGLKPEIEPDDVRQTLREVSESKLDWNAGDDATARKTLVKLCDRLNRISRLKQGGVAAYSGHPAVQIALEALIEKCAKCGLFFPKVGELEDWASSITEGVSKRAHNKTERAAIVADRIRGADTKAGDVWDFTRAVFAFLAG
jgi:hypothetical protein